MPFPRNIFGSTQHPREVGLQDVVELEQPSAESGLWWPDWTKQANKNETIITTKQTIKKTKKPHPKQNAQLN